MRRCQSLQVFTSAPVQWAGRAFTAAESEAFVAARLAADIVPLFIHAPYLLNLATADRALRSRSLARLITDLRTADQWQAAGVVLHLGSGGPEATPPQARRRVASALREARERSGANALLLLENSAGQGRIVGASPDELGDIMAQAAAPGLGVCLDTAHAFAAGHAIHEPAGLTDFLARLDAACGPTALQVVHANDSLGAFGSHRDRHWHIGQGEIGPRGWRCLMGHARLQGLPFIMETPKEHGTELQEDLRNLKALRGYVPRAWRPPLPRAPGVAP